MIAYLIANTALMEHQRIFKELVSLQMKYVNLLSIFTNVIILKVYF